MSLRCIWIINVSTNDFGKILFYRTFPTVEKRCKLHHKTNYVSLPAPSVFVNSLLIKLGLSVSSKQFIEWRDKPYGSMQLPVIDVKIGDHEMWPVVAIVKQSVVVCCLPFVESEDAECKENLLHPSISIGFSVLLGILNFLFLKSQEERTSQLKELDTFLTLNMPFGVPSDMDISSMSCLSSLYTSQKFTRKQPAWKPIDYKGKPQIYLKISEYVRCIQSEQNKSVCRCEVYGQIAVRASLEGTLNDVTLSVTSEADSSHPLDSIILHPCIQAHGAISASASVSNLLRRLRFSPPLHEIILLQYCCPESNAPPIQGIFKMLGENPVDLFIQLKLSGKVKNAFEYCDVILVFFNRGPVKSLEFNTNHSTAKLSDDKHSLKWAIGTKFPKELEVALSAKLEFDEKPIMPQSDPFCVDKNCYVQINFKQNNYTLSGCNVDAKSIIVSQASKPKITIERSVESTEYRLWNNYGDLPFSIDIEEKFEKFMKES